MRTFSSSNRSRIARYRCTTLTCVPSGPDSRGNSSGICVASCANRSPRTLSKPLSPQRAAATCSPIVTLRPRVQSRWGDNGLLNVRGDLFAHDATHIPLELPRLSGPDGTQVSVVQRYLAMRDRLLELNVRITALRLDARGAWQFDLDDGVTVRLGRQHLDERFNTFVVTAARIVAPRATDIAYVDMRYANGFAIGWRSGGAGDAKNRGDARNV